MQVFQTAVAAVVVFCLGVACVAAVCLLITEVVHNIAHTRYTGERAAYIREKRLEIERQGKAGKV